MKTKKREEQNSIKKYNQEKSDQFLINEKCSDTLTKNYMPYAMSVIVSRALPEIDGLKPAHRKILYTMYQMGLLKNQRTKSANIVGQTMRLNPHGDISIYETMCRMTQNQESLLIPYVDGKGNFGKSYSRDMACAHQRYTEAKLAPVAEELFKDINKNTVEFVPNYDNTMKEPSLLPVSFPTILANSTLGIAVGMASNICSYNLKELCEATIGVLKNKNFDILSVMPAPDFPTGGEILWDENQMKQIINTGKGSVVVRAKYHYDKKNNVIEITEIPPTTTIEAIVEKVTDLVKQGKIKEINDIRDETDLDGLKIAIDMKRGQDIEQFMLKMFKLTPCQDTYSCNFNVLINGFPKVLGINDILNEWIKFRVQCVKNRTQFEIDNKKSKLHILKGLEKILVNIDKAIKIIRETENDEEVVKNLMVGFDIDTIQAEYIADIKLRYLNKDYILKRLLEIKSLSEEILKFENIVKSENKIKQIIVKELQEISKKYGKDRKSSIIYEKQAEYSIDIDTVKNYPVSIFITKELYVKKITPQSLRMSSEQKLKENDEIQYIFDTNNENDLLLFTDKQQCYKIPIDNINQCKASVLGDFIPNIIQLDNNENIIKIINADKKYNGHLLFVFENGKVAKITLNSYFTKTNRKKLINAYSDTSKVVKIYHILQDEEIFIQSTDKKGIIFNTKNINEKTTKNTIGVTVLKLKPNQTIKKSELAQDINIKNKDKYYVNIATFGYNPIKK